MPVLQHHHHPEMFAHRVVLRNNHSMSSGLALVAMSPVLRRGQAGHRTSRHPERLIPRLGQALGQALGSFAEGDRLSLGDCNMEQGIIPRPFSKTRPEQALERQKKGFFRIFLVLSPGSGLVYPPAGARQAHNRRRNVARHSRLGVSRGRVVVLDRSRIVPARAASDRRSGWRRTVQARAV